MSDHHLISDDPDRDGRDTSSVHGRRYDSFVIRIWIEPARAVWLRAEVLHVQTGLLERAYGITPTWLQQTIVALLELDDPGANHDSPARS